MKITYTRKGDYLFPELELRETETRYIGKYGILRKTYLKEHRSGWYQSMLLTGKLDSHLADVDNSILPQFSEELFYF